MHRLIRSGRILILSLLVCLVGVLEVASAQTPSRAERSATFDALQRGGRGGRRGGRRGRGGERRRGPEFERRMKYREAGELLNQFEDGLRKLELLTREDVPEMIVRRWDIATGILRDMRKNTESFVEALWLESIDVEELITSVEPIGSITPDVGIASLRGSIDQLRYMWRRWRADNDIVDVERYEELQNEAVQMLVTVDALLTTSTEDLVAGLGGK